MGTGTHWVQEQPSLHLAMLTSSPHSFLLPRAASDPGAVLALTEALSSMECPVPL